MLALGFGRLNPTPGVQPWGVPEEDVVGKQDGVGVPEEDVVGKQDGAGSRRWAQECQRKMPKSLELRPK